MDEFDGLIGQICNASCPAPMRAQAEQRLMEILSDRNAWKSYAGLLVQASDMIVFFVCIGFQRLLWRHWSEISVEDRHLLKETVVTVLSTRELQPFAISKVEQLLATFCANTCSIQPAIPLLSAAAEVVESTSSTSGTDQQHQQQSAAMVRRGLSAMRTTLELILSEDPKLYPEHRAPLLGEVQELLQPLCNFTGRACSIALADVQQHWQGLLQHVAQRQAAAAATTPSLLSVSSSTSSINLNNSNSNSNSSDDEMGKMLAGALTASLNSVSVSLEVLKVIIAKQPIGPHISNDVIDLLFNAAEVGAAAIMAVNSKGREAIIAGGTGNTTATAIGNGNTTSGSSGEVQKLASDFHRVALSAIEVVTELMSKRYLPPVPPSSAAAAGAGGAGAVNSSTTTTTTTTTTMTGVSSVPHNVIARMYAARSVLTHSLHITQQHCANKNSRSKSSYGRQNDDGRGRRERSKKDLFATGGSSSGGGSIAMSVGSKLCWFECIVRLCTLTTTHIHPWSVRDVSDHHQQVCCTTSTLKLAHLVLLNMERIIIVASQLSLPNLNASIGTIVYVVTHCIAYLHQTSSSGGDDDDDDRGSIDGLVHSCGLIINRLLGNISNSRVLEKHAPFIAAAIVEVLGRASSNSATPLASASAIASATSGNNMIVPTPAGAAASITRTGPTATAAAVAVVSLKRIPKVLQDTIYPGIFALFEHCQAREKSQMFSMLDPASRALMADLHAEFMRTFKFVGK